MEKNERGDKMGSPIITGSYERKINTRDGHRKYNVGIGIPIEWIVIGLGLILAASIIIGMRDNGEGVEVNDYSVKENWKLGDDTGIEVNFQLKNYESDEKNIRYHCILYEGDDEIAHENKTINVGSDDEKSVNIKFDANDDTEYSITTDFYEVQSSGEELFLEARSNTIKT